MTKWPCYFCTVPKRYDKARLPFQWFGSLSVMVVMFPRRTRRRRFSPRNNETDLLEQQVLMNRAIDNLIQNADTLVSS
jgi:hypothetical protein